MSDDRWPVKLVERKHRALPRLNKDGQQVVFLQCYETDESGLAIAFSQGDLPSNFRNCCYCGARLDLAKPGANVGDAKRGA